MLQRVAHPLQPHISHRHALETQADQKHDGMSFKDLMGLCVRLSARTTFNVIIEVISQGFSLFLLQIDFMRLSPTKHRVLR